MGAQAGHRRLDTALRIVIYGLATIVVLLLIAVLVARLYYLVTPNVSASAQVDVLERANDAVNAVNLLLSFLEGASVLIGLGFGAAALYGIRSVDEVRKELETEVERMKALQENVRQDLRVAAERDEQMRRRLEGQIEILEGYRPELEQIRGLRQEIVAAQEELALVQQADQEFRLGNYGTAYRFATQVLAHNPDNWLALYIAGWLEVHQRDDVDGGIAHLKRVIELKRDWPAALAAYGVALRRKARRAEGEERNNLFNAAEGALLQALGESPKLVDFNGESFWGPVGGIRLETGRHESAIEAYEHALEVTPDSSYPAGNLATLYLQRARRSGDPADRERALDAFVRTLRAARREQILKPNDYYLWMDVAQAQTMLGIRDEANFASAQDALATALHAHPSVNMLETSRRGWRSLLESCPEDWPVVRTHLQAALEALDAAIAATDTARP